MKKYIIILMVLVVTNILAQDTIRIKHTNYQTVFSKSKKYPVLVEWWVTKKMVTCPTPLKRKDVFAPDPKLPKETNLMDDYKGSGTDRGHMMPAADNLCQTQKVQDECFYFSNMAPQYHSLNAGDWKSLETWTREIAQKYDSIYVWCGNIGVEKKIGSVSVPTECWKVVYIKQKKEYHYFIFKNKTEKQTGFEDDRVTKAVIEKKTGFKFKK